MFYLDVCLFLQFFLQMYFVDAGILCVLVVSRVDSSTCHRHGPISFSGSLLTWPRMDTSQPQDEDPRPNDIDEPVPNPSQILRDNVEPTYPYCKPPRKRLFFLKQLTLLLKSISTLSPLCPARPAAMTTLQFITQAAAQHRFGLFDFSFGWFMVFLCFVEPHQQFFELFRFRL